MTDDLAAGLTADLVYDSVDELAWAVQAQPATLACSPAFSVWPRPDTTFKPRLSRLLATPQGTRRVTVLFDTGATWARASSSARPTTRTPKELLDIGKLRPRLDGPFLIT